MLVACVNSALITGRVNYRWCVYLLPVNGFVPCYVALIYSACSCVIINCQISVCCRIRVQLLIYTRLIESVDIEYQLWLG